MIASPTEFGLIATVRMDAESWDLLKWSRGTGIYLVIRKYKPDPRFSGIDKKTYMYQQEIIEWDVAKEIYGLRRLENPTILRNVEEEE